MKSGLDYVVAVLFATAAAVFLWIRLRTVRMAVRIASQILKWALLGLIRLLVITRLALSVRALGG